jgi:2-hydroxychromene-2-carboxylate isomerase
MAGAGMTSESIDFWYYTSSTYTYLTVMQIGDVAAKAGVKVRWRPFHLNTLLRENGVKPFPPGASKTAYMWRDLERRAQMHEISFPSEPPPYPCDPDILNFRVALVAFEQGWAQEHARASYDWWFRRGTPVGLGENRVPFLRSLGKDADAIIARAHSEDIDAKIIASADEARELGLFGSPHFVVGREVFWGDDRLEDAVSWAKHGNVIYPR